MHPRLGQIALFCNKLKSTHTLMSVFAKDELRGTVTETTADLS